MSRYIHKHFKFLALAFICCLISTTFATLVQFYKGDILDNAISGNINTTILYLCYLIGGIVIECGFFYLYNQFGAYFKANTFKSIKNDLFQSIIHRNYVSYLKNSQGDYIAKYTNDVELIRDMFFATILSLFEILSKIVFVTVALLILDWRIAIIAIVLLTTPLYIPKIIEKKLQNAQNNYVKAVEDNLEKVSNWLSCFEIIKNYSVEKQILSKFYCTNDHVMKCDLKNRKVGNLSRLISMLISYLSYFIVLLFSAVLVLNGDFSAGEFFVSIGMVDQLSWPLISLSDLIGDLIKIKPIYRNILEFIKSNPKTTDKSITTPALLKEVRFDNVSFTHSENSSGLSNFTLVMKKGGRYLLCGPSGCGKTTMTNLLLQYYEATSGQITIDGIPLSQCHDLYSLITVDRQDATLLWDTVRNNLTMYTDYNDADLIAYLKRFGLNQFASADGLDIVIKEGGSNLSGGERKRICLIRALLRNTPILILDEPLANLDPDMASIIEDEILQTADRTILIVSHQFSENKIDQFDAVITMTKSVNEA